MGFEGGHSKKYGFQAGKGAGQAKKNIGCKGVVTKRILSSFAVTVSVVTKMATASKTSPKKSIRAASNFITLIATLLTCQMLAYFFKS